MSAVTIRGRRWMLLRRKLIREAGHQCVRCGRNGRMELHHIVPVSKGGDAYDESNIEVLCRRCHMEHHHPGATKFYHERNLWLGRLLAGR